MTVRVVERVDGWEEEPHGGGYGGLQDLADREFSGVVRAGGAELYMTVGTVVGVRRGTIEDFEGATGTAYESPHPALPLLAIMQEADADARAEYYTEETPISEVDRTLSDGGFTGYVELSENVLSGDYFQVYHGGESMSVAFVGESERLLSGDEAFETADDEVGIYRVRPVDVEPIEIPAADGTADAPAQAATADGAEAVAEAGDEGTTDASEESEGADATQASGDAGTSADEAADETETGDDARDDSAAADSRDGAGEDAGGDPDEAAAGSATDAAADAPESDDTPASDDAQQEAQAGGAPAADTGESPTDDADPQPDDAAATGRTGSGRDADSGETARASGGQSGAQQAQADRSRGSGQQGDRRSGGTTESASRTDPNRTEPRRSDTAGRAATTGQSGGGSPRGDERRRSPASQAGDLETRAIPSLDPGQTKVPQREERSSTGGSGPERTPGGAGQPREGPGGSGGTSQNRQPADRREPGSAGAQSEAAGAGVDDAAGGAPSADVEALESELAEREAEIERLESRLADATDEREDLEAELEAVREERDELAAEVERLETELDRLESEFGAATDADRRMTPTEAIEGTNLFVDYDSKGDATLEKAHGGSEAREEVGENLQVGVHTEFDDDTVAVGGQDFDEFLRSTLHYRFAEWVVSDLLFEIRDTGHGEALGDLYDAIPEIRRVEFNGVVDVEYVEDGQEKGGREEFDVIFRHRMGDPLLVANLNDSRDPATGGMMDSLVTAAERVGQTEESLAAAFLVTSSFFESEALETVGEATRSGILSRDSRDSFVNLSRKTGYHLCLVAARESNFHMEVPEL